MKSIWLVLGIVLIPVTAVQADWLVMNDGTEIETQGTWKVKGAMVVFTLPSGSLASVRTDEVNLDASAVATVAAKEAAEAPPEPPPKAEEKKPMAVLTTQDIGRAKRIVDTVTDDEESTPEEANSDQEQDGLEATPINVEVISWRDVDNIAVQGVELRGVLRNSGDTLARELVLIVSLYDNNGELVASSEAFLDQYLLQPSATTNFRVLFPEVATYFGEPGYQIRGRGPLYGKITGITNPREEPEEAGTTDVDSGSG